MNRFVALAILALGLCVAPIAQSALPPGYGGVLRVPGTAGLRLPDPTDVRTPLEATVVAGVYDTLYTLRGNRVVPSLAAALPEMEGDIARVRLRQGIRRHDRRPLTARDVVRAFRPLLRSTSEPWLSGLARRGGGLDMRAEDETTIAFRLEDPEFDLARRLAATPLSIRLGQGHGTGPYRARLRDGALHLYQFRPAARGAPRLRAIHIEPARSRDDELRAFDLGELDVSWRGASLYGQPGREVVRHALPASTPVLLVPQARQRGRLGPLARTIDRRRLARVGLDPGDHIGDLPAPVARGSQTGALRLMVVAGDPLQEELAAALAARFDEVGWRTTILRKDSTRYDVLVRTDQWDLRIVQLPPPLPDDRSLLAAAWIAVGSPDRARELLGGAGPDRVAQAARELPAIVLGQRQRTMHHLPTLRGVEHDPWGRVLLHRAFLPRSDEP
ncbi:MAG: ABC transporter substrate-binding protein [Myxococcota bacterium]